MRMIRIITIVSMVMVSYPVFELTRCIILYMISTDIFRSQPLHVYYAELVLIWVFYLSLPFVINMALTLVWKMGKAQALEG